MNEFISFWFYTSVDDQELYETDLDFQAMEWSLYHKDTEEPPFQKGLIRKYSGVEDEKAEIERIKLEVECIVKERS